MGLIELIGEWINPGKVGTVDISKGEKEKHLGLLMVKTFLSTVIIGGLYWLILGLSFHVKELLSFIAGITVYSTVSYFISPRPDYSNIGWAGGLFNNPFRISDDMNRMLIFIMVLLMPGRLISTTVLSLIDLFRE